MKKVLIVVAIFTIVVFSYAIAQQTQPATDQKNGSTMCGKHTVQVEKQSERGGCCAKSDCAEMMENCQKLHNLEMKQSSGKSNCMDKQPKAIEPKPVKSAEKPTGK